MKKLLARLSVAVAIVATVAGAYAAVDGSGRGLDKKRVGAVERVKAMTRVGEARQSARAARAEARLGSGSYGTVNGSMLFTVNSRLTDRRVYTIDPVSSTMTMLDTPEVFATGGGVLIGDKYYCMTRLKVMRNVYTRFYVFDADNWDTLEYKPDQPETLNATDVTYDPTTGRVYGCFYNSADSWTFGTIDYSTLTRSDIAPCPQLNALAADEAGKLYAIDMDGVFYGVDKLSGTLSRIADTGIKASYRSSYWQGSAVYDPESGTILYAANSTTAANPSDADFIGALWSIDPATGSATQLRHFPGEELFDGLYIPREELIDEVPAAPTELVAEFPGASLSGTVSFRMPSKLVGGMSASGQLDYEVKANGTVAASGKAAPGAEVSVNLTLDRGSYCIGVTASNSEGPSRETTVILFVGVDSPAQPAVKASYDYAASTAKLEWAPVTATDFGTPLPEGSVRYSVTRLPEREVVASDLDATTFSEPISSDGLKTIAYEVTATSGGESSGAARTSDLIIGAATPYYMEDFDLADALRWFTVIDADGDRLTWEASDIDNAARIAWNNLASDDDRKDDWLISPPLALEAGKIYKFTYGARKLYDAETLSVSMGRAPEASAMTTVLVAPYQVTTDRTEQRTLDVTVDTDGVYFIGFHATSPRTSGALYISPFIVAEGVASGAPAAVTAMEVTPAADRSHSATITFTAPSATMDGSALASLTAVDVYRDGSLIGNTTAAPGASGSYTDTEGHQGMNLYTLRPRNEAGSGAPAELSVFLGWDEPNRVERVRAAETATDGEVTVTWNAPELDNNNSPLTEEALRYDVFMSAVLPSGKTEVTQVGSDVKGTSHKVVVCSPEERRFAEFNVVAKTEGGEAREVWTPEAVPVGKAYATPFAESFANARFTNFWGIYSDDLFGFAGASWDFSDDYTFDITSKDGDNGFIVLEGSEAGDESEFYSSKINLAGLSNPALTFYSYNVKGSSSDEINNNILTISAFDGMEKTVVASVNMSQYNNDGWQRVNVPLTGLEGKTVQLFIKGTIVNFLTIALDNLRVDATFDRNLTAEPVTAPQKVMLDKKFIAYATVRNTGIEPMEPYTLDFYCGETKMETRNGRALQPGETQMFDFDCVRDITSDEVVEYWCRVTAAGDQNEADNTSARAQVKVCVPNYPVVTTLSGSVNDHKPLLTWSAPNLAVSEPFEIIEDFESYPAFANSNLWDWTLHDADGAFIGGIEDANDGAIELPGIPTASRQSWFVMDGDYEKLNFTYRAHSGRQHIATMYCYGIDNGIGYETANDDWLISPEVAPGSTDVSFFARGYSNMSPDALEVLITTESGPDPTYLRYRSLGKIDPMPTDWAEYFVELPAGTKRFAIRSVGNFGFMLFVDDITFTPADCSSLLEVVGYNIYRDGERVNAEPVATPEYRDETAADGNHEYAVTVVYSRGESRLSNRVSLTSALETPEVAAASVRADAGAILVDGAGGKRVSVCAADGRVVFDTADAANAVRVSVAPGIYLVTVDGDTVKLIVR